MSDEAPEQPTVHVEPQPTPEIQSSREWLARGVKLMDQARRAEDAAKAGAPEPAQASPAPKQPETPKPAAPAGSTVQDRRAAREARRAEAEQYRQQAEQIAAYAREREPSAQKWEAIQQAHARGDFEGVARLLGADSWNAVQDHYVRVLSDPGYTRVLELEQRIAAREAAERQAAERAQMQAAHAQRQQNINRLKLGLSERMKTSSDPILADFHNDPSVVEPLFAAMVRHFEATGEDLTSNPEKALTLKQPNGLTILEGLESCGSFADRYRAARARKAAPPAAKQTAEQPRTKPAPKPKPKPEPEPQRWGWQPDKKRDADAAWEARAKRDLERAFGEERRRERR